MSYIKFPTVYTHVTPLHLVYNSGSLHVTYAACMSQLIAGVQNGFLSVVETKLQL